MPPKAPEVQQQRAGGAPVGRSRASEVLLVVAPVVEASAEVGASVGA